MLRSLVDKDTKSRLQRLDVPFNAFGYDPYGISREALGRAFSALRLLYRHYLRVNVRGIEHVPTRGRAMLIGNHSGGLALDAGVVLAATFYELEPPRLAHSMVEKFVNRVPFFSQWANRTGQFTGLPEHAARLLEDERMLLIFPEGARGTAKLYWESSSLVRFGTGFMRLALETHTPIVPFAFIGGGDAIPTVFNAYKLGRAVGAPYLPITPYLLPIPLPTSVELRFGEPMRFFGTGAESDEVIDGQVEQVKAAIAGMLEEGKRERKLRGRLGA